MIFGVLADTHGTLHPRVVEVFREAGVERILHAGDVGGFAVIGELSRVAPVTAVRGNIDHGGHAASLPDEARFTVEGVEIYMTHIGAKPYLWLPRLAVALPGVAICGHSHIALLEKAGGILFLNPGAAGTVARFGQPPTAAILRVNEGEAGAEIITL